MNDKTPRSPLADPVPPAPAAARPPPDIATGINRPRKPFGTVESKLAFPPIPGFHMRWFNDDGGRIDRAKEAGYEHVRDEGGAPIKQIVGTKDRGGALDGFIMKIPDAWYDEDFALKQGSVDMVDLALMRGRLTPAKADDMAYVPRDGAGQPMIRMGAVRGRNPNA